MVTAAEDLVADTAPLVSLLQQAMDQNSGFLKYSAPSGYSIQAITENTSLSTTAGEKIYDVQFSRSFVWEGDMMMSENYIAQISSTDLLGSLVSPPDELPQPQVVGAAKIKNLQYSREGDNARFTVVLESPLEPGSTLSIASRWLPKEECYGYCVVEDFKQVALESTGDPLVYGVSTPSAKLQRWERDKFVGIDAELGYYAEIRNAEGERTEASAVHFTQVAANRPALISPAIIFDTTTAAEKVQFIFR